MALLLLPSLGQAQLGNTAAAYANFALLSAEITFVDWLQLGDKQHRRAQFTWTGSDWCSTSVMP